MNNAAYDQYTLQQRLSQYPGAYECHITVDISTEQTTAFTQWCQHHDASAVVIELAQGTSRHQPMLCKQFYCSPEQAYAEINALYQALAEHHDILRLKVEAGIQNTNLPQNDLAAQGLPADCYFEHHVKIKLPAGTDVEQLREPLQAYDGHLSRNALSDKTTSESRFITQRYYNVGNGTARQGLDSLLTFLHQQGIETTKTIREFNIFDSKIALDAGWMNETGIPEQ